MHRHVLILALCCLCAHAYRLAVGSCSHQTRHQPLWADIVAQDPDSLLMIGDFVYADGKHPIWPITSVPSSESALHKILFRDQLEHPDFQPLVKWRARDGKYAVWDDHDYNLNDGDASNPSKYYARDAFVEFLRRSDFDVSKLSSDSMSSMQQLLALDGGRLVIVMLDTRFHAHFTQVDGWMEFDPLGAEQWVWLEQQLRCASDFASSGTRPHGCDAFVSSRAPELVMIVSSVQAISSNKIAAEGWFRSPQHRRRLMELVTRSLWREHGKSLPVIYLAGDVHLWGVLNLLVDISEASLVDLCMLK